MELMRRKSRAGGRNRLQFCVTFSRKHERLFPISIIFALFFYRIGI